MVFGQALADLGGEPPVLGEPRLYLSDQRALARGLGGRVALIAGRHGLSLAGADRGGNASRARSAPGGPVMIEAGCGRASFAPAQACDGSRTRARASSPQGRNPP